VQKKAAKFAGHTKQSNWETVPQRRKISRICALFKAYSGERAWKAIGDRLQRPNYLSRVDHERKIRNGRHRTDIGIYSFVNRTIQLWNRLPAEILGTLSCKPNAFRKRARKWLMRWTEGNVRVLKLSKSVVKWSELKRRVLQWRGVNRGVPWRVLMEIMEWSEVNIMLKLVWNTCGVKILEARCSTFFPLCCFSYLHCY